MYNPNQNGHRNQSRNRYNDQYRRYAENTRPNDIIALDESYDRRNNDFERRQYTPRRNKYYKRYDSREGRRDEFIDQNYGPDNRRRYDFDKDRDIEKDRRKKRRRERRHHDYRPREPEEYREPIQYTERHPYPQDEYVDSGYHDYQHEPSPLHPHDKAMARAEGVKYEPKPEVNYYVKEEREKSKSCVVYCLLIFALICLVGALSIGIVSTILEPWWTHDRQDGERHVEIGLWKACYKEISDYTCRDYEDTATEESPYDNIDVLKYCMIAGDAVTGVALLALILAIIIRNKSPFRVVMYIVLFLTLSGVALFVVVIGFALEVKDPDEILPNWILSKLTSDERKNEVDKALFLILTCVCAGVVGLALILIGVFLFIDDDPEIYETEENPGHERSDSFSYDKSAEIKRPQQRIEKPTIAPVENETPFFINPAVTQPVVYKSPEFYEYGKQDYRENERPRIERPVNRNAVPFDNRRIPSNDRLDIADHRQFEDRTERYNKYREEKQRVDHEVVLVNRPQKPLSAKSAPLYYPDQRLPSGTARRPDYPESLPPPIGSTTYRDRSYDIQVERTQSPTQYEMYFNSPY